MIKEIRITKKIINARITSGARQTIVSIKSRNRIKGFFIGIQGPAGRDGQSGLQADAPDFSLIYEIGKL